MGHIGQIPIFRKPFTVSWWSFHGKKMTSKMTPRVFQEKKLQVEVCLMFMTGLSEACPYCFPMFSLPNLQFSMYKSLSGRTGVLISWPLRGSDITILHQLVTIGHNKKHCKFHGAIIVGFLPSTITGGFRNPQRKMSCPPPGPGHVKGPRLGPQYGWSLFWQFCRPQNRLV